MHGPREGIEKVEREHTPFRRFWYPDKRSAVSQTNRYWTPLEDVLDAKSRRHLQYVRIMRADAATKPRHELIKSATGARPAARSQQEHRQRSTPEAGAAGAWSTAFR